VRAKPKGKRLSDPNWKQNTEVVAVLAARFGWHLKRLREDRKLTLEELGARLSLSNGYLSMLETGKRSPSIEVVERVATHFGIKDPSALLKDVT